MATLSYKVLGQHATSAPNTPVLLYQVGVGISTVISSLIIANRGNTSTTFKVEVRVGGEVTDSKQVIFPDVSILKNSSFSAVLGLTLAETDELWVSGGNGNLSFNLFGSELS